MAKQSLNGLNTTTIETITTAGIYFISGKLSLPQLPTGASGPSAVVATVKQNGSTIYTGTAGASGFSIPQVTCATGDILTVALSSSNSADQGLNAVLGQVVSTIQI